jgi:predicted CopG family antitoxin
MQVMHVVQDVQIHLKSDTYVKLSELKARLRKRSMDEVIRELLKVFESGATGVTSATTATDEATATPRELFKQIAEVLETHGKKLDGMLALMDKLEQVLKRLSQVIDSLEQFVESQKQQAVSATAPPTTEGQKPAETPTTAETQPAETGERKPQTHTWCRKKSEIRNLEGFVEWVKQNYGLIDWWEEKDGRVCFETERKPEKGRRGGGGG